MISPLKCFDLDTSANRLDQQAFKFPHKLLGHPSMEMANLIEVIPRLPQDHVFYSSGKLDKNVDFATAHLDYKNGLSIEETIQSMKDVDSYIMVARPEADPSFKELFKEICSDVEEWSKASRMGNRTLNPMFYMFIASPNSVTPFHIDRISTILMQFQGRKTVTVFPAWDERTVPSDIRESFMVRTGARPHYNSSFEHLGQPFDFGPGEALHIPLVAPHHVKNGSDEVSISLSITFHSSHSERLKEAMHLNHLMRRRLKVRPTPVGQYEELDFRKARIYGGYKKVKSLLRARS